MEHKDETSTRWQLNRDGFLWRDSPSRGKSVFLQTDLQLHVDPTPVPQNVQAQGQAPAQDPVQEQDQNDQAPVQGQAPAQAPVQEQDQNAQAQDQAPKTPMHKFAEEEGGRRDLNNQSVALLGSDKKECQTLKKFFCFVESAEDRNSLLSYLDKLRGKLPPLRGDERENQSQFVTLSHTIVNEDYSDQANKKFLDKVVELKLPVMRTHNHVNDDGYNVSLWLPKNREKDNHPVFETWSTYREVKYLKSYGYKRVSIVENVDECKNGSELLSMLKVNRTGRKRHQVRSKDKNHKRKWDVAKTTSATPTYTNGSDYKRICNSKNNVL